MIMMEDKKTFIKLDKGFESWRWFKDKKTLVVYIYLLASANLEAKEEFRETVGRGSLLTNNASIAYDCGLTIQNVRAALTNLQKSGDITREYRNHYQIITVADFDSRIID